MERQKGANILFKIDDRQFAGVTSDDFDLTVNMVESQTKDDGGVMHRLPNGYTYTFSIAGIMSIGSDGDATFIDNEEILDLAIAGTPVEFVYGNFTTKKGLKKGKAIISGYAESSPVDGNATYSLSLQSSSDLTPVAQE